MAWVDLRRRVRQANNRITRMEKIYGTYDKDGNIKSPVMKRVYKTLEEVYGRPATRYKISDNMSLRQLSKIDTALELLLNSAYSTAAGRRDIQRKAEKSWQENNPDISLKAYRSWLSLKKEMQSFVYESSEQLIAEIDDIMAMGYTEKDIMEIAIEYTKKLEEPSYSESAPSFIDYLFGRASDVYRERELEGSSDDEILEKRRFYGL